MHHDTIFPTIDDARWQAVVDRDTSADGQFVLAVRTTGIFCRPGCPARTPRRENVQFFESTDDALRAGYRPCKRCRPTGKSVGERQDDVVEAVRRRIESSPERLSLAQLAEEVGLSPWHLQRLFRERTGLSPAQYGRSLRSSRLRETLPDAASVTRALHDAGYDASSTFYEAAPKDIGMTPTQFRRGGTGQRIRYGIVETWLGYLLVAATDRGITSLQMGESAEEMRERLETTFPNAELVDDDPEFHATLESVARLAEHPSETASLPLDARGTAFQHRVWNALRQIPAGSTRTYSEVAEAIGSPKAVRAVAKACADNPIPLLVPCHRVIGKDGSLTGYRYGIPRKRALLDREATGD